MTTAAQANTVNTLISIARLQQSSQELRSRQELRRDAQEKLRLATRAAEDKAADEDYKTAVQGIFGDKPTPEIEQYTEPTRAMFQRGATTEAAIPSGERSPMGFPLVDAVRRQPTPTDVAGSLRRGGMEARAESEEHARSLGIDVKEPNVFARLQTQKKVPLPSQVAGMAEEYRKGEQSRSLSLEKAAKAREVEADATFKEQSMGTRISQEASKAKFEGAKADREAIQLEIDEVYAKPLAELNKRFKTAETTLKEADVTMLPVTQEQTRQNLIKTRKEIRDMDEQYRHVKQVRGQIDIVNSLPDGAKRDLELEKLMSLTGNAGGVRSQNREINQAYIEGTKKQLEATIAARGLLNDGKVDEAVAVSQGANQMALSAAQIVRAPRMKVTAIVPGGQGLFGGSGGTLSVSDVETQTAKLFIEGTLDKVARLEAVTPGWTPAQALAETIRIRHAYANDDTTTLARAISASSAPQMVKDDATQLLMKASALVKPVKITEPEKPAVGSYQLTPEREKEQADKRAKIRRYLGRQTTDVGGAMP